MGILRIFSNLYILVCIIFMIVLINILFVAPIVDSLIDKIKWRIKKWKKSKKDC